MAFIGVHVTEEVKARFLARAQMEGGQSALLRRLLTVVTEQTADGAKPLAGALSDKITVRFRGSERAAITDAAAARGMTRTGWMASVVRARLGLGLPLNRGEEEALRAIARELHGIGTSLNQIARTVAQAAQAGEPITLDPVQFDDIRAATHVAINTLRQTLTRSVESWQELK